MGGERRSIEREAERLYRAAKLDFASGAAPGSLIRRLLGPKALRTAPAAVIPTDGFVARVQRSWRIYLRDGLPQPRARFIALHELSHWALGPSATEHECDALAAALLAPRPAFERAAQTVGADYTALARCFGCTETFAALRYGEVTEEPLVVIAPANVRIRGREYSWPAERELRGLAKGRHAPGIAKARLRDDPARITLRPVG